ncbi:MAG TPA: hypothetical protein QGG59_01265 [Planctomycetota bacterium]|jgi:hypothetical protein|nr:hypothetical protein [Planctomycetota bacterium]MDP7245120.1 hypothetical protein [Planctomycetota bacterium]MDP7560091.1 hypothetical protein [Planctomycetota bacterium]HJM38721.1 hypothetical protein [Planctomycetota bacterium]|tara:strand:- start:49606 stop:50013 length:408 start_codon:yes stop_codon:yes gene_type:complete
MTRFFMLLPLVFLQEGCEGNVVLADTSCLEVRALGAAQSNSGWSFKGLTISAGKTPCPQLEGAQLTMFNNNDGKEGFSDPPDKYVSGMKAKITVPSDTISFGSFQNQNSQGVLADSWELVILDDSGKPNTFSGSF